MDIKNVIGDFLLRNYGVNVQYANIKHANYLNVVLKSLKTLGLT